MHRAISLVALLAAPAWAVPATFTHQGRLLDAEGAPRNGAVTLDFGLYAAPTGGGAVWTESHDVALADGHYSVVLGEASPLGAHLAAATTWYLGVSVGGDALGPRTPLLSVPYAARAGGVVTHADSPPPCDAAAVGGLAYDTVAGALQVCDGDAWQDVGGSGAPSCAELKRRNPASPSQVYTIYPDGVELSAFCDMGTEQGGWTLCLAVETTSRHQSDDFPDGSRWYDAVFTDRSGNWVAFDGSAPLPGRGEVAGSFGCERLEGAATEIWFQAIYTNGQTKSLIATLPQAALSGTWTATSTRLEKRGTWSASTVDRLCAIDSPNLLIAHNAGSCANTAAYPSAASAFLLGAIGPSYENGTGTCDGATKLDTCGVFLTDNQDAWTGENDEIGDHGTYGGWGWGGDPSPQRVNVYLR